MNGRFYGVHLPVCAHNSTARASLLVMAAEKQLGVLPYSLVPRGDGSLVMALLLWRDPAGSSGLQSGKFFSDMVCTRTDTDASASDAAARVFSEKTRGLFAPKAQGASATGDAASVDLSRRILAQKLRKQDGIVQLNNSLYRVCMVPVRYASEAEVSGACGGPSPSGEAHWCLVPDLLRLLHSEQAQRGAAELCVPRADRLSPALPLYLPFSALFRQQAIVDQLTALAASLSPQVGGKTIHIAELAAGDADVSSEQSSNGGSRSSCSNISDASAQVLSWGDVDDGAASAATSAASASASSAANPNETCYLCKFCRAVLFRESDLLPHDEGEGQTGFEYRKRSAATKSVCTSYFTNALPWMNDNDEFAANEGKLNCPHAKCGSRLGSYNWSGDQCSCGAWVVPSLQFLRKSMDIRAAPAAPVALARPLVARRAPFVPTRVVKSGGNDIAAEATSAGGNEE